MDFMEKQGGHPQNESSQRAGVSLTRPERTFLDAMTDPLSACDLCELIKVGQSCGLRIKDVEYIVEWVRNHGAHLLTCEKAHLNAEQGANVFRNPLVRRIINAAAEAGYCLPTSAFKEEIEDFLSQQMRNPSVPDSLRESAADKLAKLKGYTDTKSNGGATVQIVVGDPYAGQGVSINGTN
jgi:hypothetical protein